MKSILTVLFVLSYKLVLFCQETKFVIKNFNNSNQVSEEYSVLKSDGRTKHGQYISYFLISGEQAKQIKDGTQRIENFIKQKGVYKNGKKYGEWLDYSRPCVLLSKGSYDNDKKIGIWVTSREQGQVLERYDFDNDKKLQPLIQIHVVYPKSAQDKEIQGSVAVNYQINKDCSITNITIVKSLSTDCDKTAIEAIQKMGELLKKYSQNCEEKSELKEVKFTLNQ